MGNKDFRKNYAHTVRSCIRAETLGSKTIYNFDKAENIVIERDIKYTDNNELYLNTYQKQNLHCDKMPVLLYLHGGGWVSGSPEGREGFTTQMAAMGFFVISIFYGLSPKYSHPLPVINTYKALEWLINNMSKYNLDLDKIVIGGESAGAHLASMMGAISSNPDYKAKFALPETSKNMKIRALILNCGLYEMQKSLLTGFPDIDIYVASYYGKPLENLKNDKNAKEMSPIYYVTPIFPPSFVITAEKDLLAPCSQDLMKVLSENKVKFTHYHGTGAFARHAFAIVQPLKITKEAMYMLNRFMIKEKILEKSTIKA